MFYPDFEQQRRIQQAWSSVAIARPVRYCLFTFGQSVLQYYLVCGDADMGRALSVTRGEVVIERPTIVTPETARPELRNFFETQEEEGIVQFLLSRSAHFSNLRLDNRSGAQQAVSDSVEAVVSRLSRQLDENEEDQVAILTAPDRLGAMAVLRYAAERVLASAPGNIQELRERGFLP